MPSLLRNEMRCVHKTRSMMNVLITDSDQFKMASAQRSSYLSSDFQLLNLTWNDTTPYRRETRGGTVWEWDDATWILASSFIIFTMQTGMPEYSYT